MRHAELFDDLQNIQLLVQLAASTFEKEVFSFALGAATAAALVIEPVDAPPSRALVGERLTVLDLVDYLPPGFLTLIFHLTCFNELVNVSLTIAEVECISLAVHATLFSSLVFDFLVVFVGGVELFDEAVGEREALNVRDGQ